MDCPLCGTKVVTQNDDFWCPSCKMFLGQLPEFENQNEKVVNSGEEKSNYGSGYLNVVVIAILVILFLAIAATFVWTYFQTSLFESSSIFEK